MMKVNNTYILVTSLVVLFSNPAVSEDNSSVVFSNIIESSKQEMNFLFSDEHKSNEGNETLKIHLNALSSHGDYLTNEIRESSENWEFSKQQNQDSLNLIQSIQQHLEGIEASKVPNSQQQIELDELGAVEGSRLALIYDDNVVGRDETLKFVINMSFLTPEDSWAVAEVEEGINKLSEWVSYYYFLENNEQNKKIIQTLSRLVAQSNNLEHTMVELKGNKLRMPPYSNVHQKKFGRFDDSVAGAVNGIKSIAPNKFLWFEVNEPFISIIDASTRTMYRGSIVENTIKNQNNDGKNVSLDSVDLEAAKTAKVAAAYGYTVPYAARDPSVYVRYPISEYTVPITLDFPYAELEFKQSVSSAPVSTNDIAPILNRYHDYALKKIKDIPIDDLKSAATNNPLWIVDFDFEDSTGHGAKVKSVVRSVLEKYGLLELGEEPYVRTIDLKPNEDNRKDYDGYLSNYRKYLASSESKNAAYNKFSENVIEWAEKYKASDEARKKIPEFLLQAIFHHIIRSQDVDSSVINISFTTKSEAHFAYMGRELERIQNENRILIFSAAGSDYWQSIGKFTTPQGYARLFPNMVVNVAGLDCTASHSTATDSRVYAEVFGLANGCGYKFENIDTFDSGSSFASPAVAASAWLSHLIYRKGDNLWIAKHDMERASIPPVPGDGKFRIGSGGIVDTSSLLEKPGSHIINNDGEYLKLRKCSINVKPKNDISQLLVKRWAINDVQNNRSPMLEIGNCGNSKIENCLWVRIENDDYKMLSVEDDLVVGYELENGIEVDYTKLSEFASNIKFMSCGSTNL